MLMAFAIFGVSVAVGLITLVLYLNPGFFGGASTSIPGPLSMDSTEGNLLEIAKEDGSLFRYTSRIHKQFGKMVSFHIGKQLVVSLADWKLVKEHMKAFADKPGHLFRLLEPLVPRSLTTNATGTMTSQTMDPNLGHHQRSQEAKIHSMSWSGPSLNFLFGRYVELSYELANKWMAQTTGTKGKLRHIPLASSSLALGAKCASVTLLGDFYADDRVVFEFKRKADKYWAEVADRLVDGVKVSSRRAKVISESIEELQRVIQGHVQCWFEAEKATVPSRWTMTDYLMDKDLPQDEVSYQLLNYFLVLLNSVGHIVSWTLYSLAKNPDAHDKLAEELRSSYKTHNTDAITLDVLESCEYLQSVVMETMRHVPLITWTSRQQDFDIPVGSQTIPKSSLVLYSVGDLCYDRDLWSNPLEFNPDRFTRNHQSAEILGNLLPIPQPPSFDKMFPPFSFSYVVSSVLVAELALKFRFSLETGDADCDVADGTPTDLGFGGRGRAEIPKNFKMLTTPKEEIWITVEPRSD